jgi:hypothetical protein
VELQNVELAGKSGFQRYVECARFELDVAFHAAFDLVADGPLSQSGDLRVRVADAVLQPGARPDVFEGARALEIVSWHFSHAFSVPGSMSCTGGAGTATPAADLQATVWLNPAAFTSRGYPELPLRIDPGAVNTTAWVTCNPGGSSTTEAVFNFDGVWRHAFADKLGPDGELLVQLRPPAGNPVGGEIVGTYGPETRTVEYGAAPAKYVITLSWSIVLRHAPER